MLLIFQLPTIIADNAGLDSSELVSQLRAAHTEKKTNIGLGMTLILCVLVFVFVCTCWCVAYACLRVYPCVPPSRAFVFVSPSLSLRVIFSKNVSNPRLQ